MATIDTTPPVLTSLAMPTNINIGASGTTATFTAGATDVGSGVDHVIALLDRSYETGFGLLNALDFTDSTSSFAGGTSTLSQTFAASTASGTYNITSLYVYDKAGNYTAYTPAQLLAAHLPTSFTVTSNVAVDNTPPVLTSLTMPTTINVGTSGTTATFSAGATDVGSEVDHVIALLDHSYQTAFGALNALDFMDSTSSFSGGTSTLSQSFSASTASGTYNITSLYVYDKAGNYTAYTPAQLLTAHLPTSFTVTSSVAVDTTPPVLTSLTMPTNINVGSSGTTAIFTAGATDVGSGVDHVIALLDRSYQTGFGSLNALDFMDSTSSFAGGTSTLSQAFAASTASGTYNITSLYVYDKGGNYTAYTPAQLQAAHDPTSFTVNASASAPALHFTEAVSGSTISVQVYADQVLSSENLSVSFTYPSSVPPLGLVTSNGLTTTQSTTSVAGSTETTTLSGQGTPPSSVASPILTLSFQAQPSFTGTTPQTYSGTFSLNFTTFTINGVAAQIAAAPQSFNFDTSNSSTGNVFYGSSSNDQFTGTGSLNTVNFTGKLSDYQVATANGVTTVADTVPNRDGTDTLTNIQQAKFSDLTLVFDLHSSQDLLVYQLYQAAYGRTPDNGGFRYWAGVADANHTSALALADNFLSAPEFTQIYGSNPTNNTYVTELYTNVLGRTPDAAGLAYWVGQADTGLARDALLVAFATSTENVQLIGSHVSNGYWTT